MNKPRYITEVTNPNGDTADIIAAVRAMYHERGFEGSDIADQFKSSNPLDAARKVYDAVNHAIKYKKDPPGIQIIKSPRRAWADGNGDCKAISILVVSILSALGYRAGFRFAAYSHGAQITHVYALLILGGKAYPIDPVWTDGPVFTQKRFTKKLDYMAQIVSVSGIHGSRPGLPLPANILEMSDGELKLWIARENRITKKAIAESVRGIGSVLAESYNDQVDVIDDMIHAARVGSIDGIDNVVEDAENGAYSIAHLVAGLDEVGRTRARKTATNKRQKNRKNTSRSRGENKKPKKGKLQNFAKKVKNGLKKAAFAVKKVAATPLRLAVTAALPAASPFFLYLFVTDKATIENLPMKARNKRKKAEAVANFVIKGLGMKSENFMGIVRTGILKKLGKEPERIISDAIKGKAIEGIGFIMDAFQLVIKLIGLIKKITGKGIDVSESDTPDPMADFAGSSPELAQDVESQADDFEADDEGEAGDDDGGSGSGGGRVRKGMCG